MHGNYSPTSFPFPPEVLFTVLCQRKSMGLGTQLMWPVGLFLAYFILQSKTKLEFNCGQSKAIHITESENLTFLWTITDSLPFGKAVLGFYIFKWDLFSQIVIAVSFKELSIEQLLFNKNQWHYFGESGMLMISSCYTPITRQPFSSWFHKKTPQAEIHDAGFSAAPESLLDIWWIFVAKHALPTLACCYSNQMLLNMQNTMFFLPFSSI